MRPAERGGEDLLRRGQYLSAHLGCEIQCADSLDCDRTRDRLAEGVASNLLWLWIAFIPILIGMKTGQLYDWIEMSRQPGAAAKYQGFLTPEWWSIRAICPAVPSGSRYCRDVAGELSLVHGHREMGQRLPTFERPRGGVLGRATSL